MILGRRWFYNPRVQKRNRCCVLSERRLTARWWMRSLLNFGFSAGAWLVFCFSLIHQNSSACADFSSTERFRSLPLILSCREWTNAAMDQSWYWILFSQNWKLFRVSFSLRTTKFLSIVVELWILCGRFRLILQMKWCPSERSSEVDELEFYPNYGTVSKKY